MLKELIIMISIPVKIFLLLAGLGLTVFSLVDFSFSSTGKIFTLGLGLALIFMLFIDHSMSAKNKMHTR